ncbi:MAG: hypothetical protein LC649_00060 [Bacteroidales bacterium]|nr:hypothetical protein [Bacteroidales bacterium]
METKDILIVALVIAVAIGSRLLRKNKGTGSVFSSWISGKRAGSKSKGSDNDLSDDDYEPYSGK